MAFNKKDEDEGHVNPFLNLEKSRVLQEARAFHDMPLKPRKCVQILTKILYLIYQGNTIGTVDATETFFAMTKLFQSKDVSLRRMVYLTIKELANLANDVIIVTSSLTKDMTGREDVYRASAIRALCKITDSSMLAGIERYLKQAVVDRNPTVASAALVSSLHLMKDNYDVVKRWVNEIQQALNSSSQMAQYHALGLLYSVKHKDRLAVSKLVTSQINSHTLRSPFAYCLLIQFASKVMAADPSGTDRSLFEFLEGCLRNKNEMVVYEAARAIVNLPNVSARELAPAVSVLQLFLSSTKPTVRFAAVRTLNKVAMIHPMSLKTCSLDMENLVTDTNRSIATLAITTLLKTGNEGSVDRLMKQISSFMSEISDEFKIFVVDALKTLCIKFPKKHQTMMNFLSGVLRDEGGYEYKKAIVDGIVSIIENVPEAKETGLGHLCEFIEDCEYSSLLTRILHMLGEQGPRTPHPSKYIRFVYNRIILENSTVRAAAISSLARFGAQCEALRPSILVLLRRSVYDGDDEVRDRATFCLNLLEQDKATASKFFVNPVPLSIVSLERSLNDYMQTPAETAFDIKSVPVDVPAVHKPDIDADPSAPSKPVTPARDVYAEQLAAIEEFSSFGPLFKSSRAVDLTERETEYVVQCIKHIFAEHVVFQFNCTNTLNDQKLEKVKVVMECKEMDFDDSDIVSVLCDELAYDSPGTTYVALPLDPTFGGESSLTFATRLDFIVKDCDPDTGEVDEEGYPDEYALEDIELGLTDLMQGVNKPNFAAAWEELEGQAESDETYELPMGSLEEAVTKISEFLGMQACEKSHKVNPSKNSHNLYLAGVYVGGHDVLAQAKLTFDGAVQLQLQVRSTDENTCDMVASCIG
eukprot:m.9153 g.9153  ORF g.9153 m.9153 type:complete len:869 (-) comp7141_c0_seq1:143-2749(-)